MSDSTAPTPTWRIAPSVPVAIGVFVAYTVAFVGLTSLAGVGLDDRFATGSNLFRGVVLPLAGACLLLVLFLLWARWDFVFTDPQRLPMSRVMWVALVVYAVAIVVQIATVDWSKASDRLLGALVASVLVGFGEETLFRGVVLRSLRTNGRAEAWAVLITTVWFGAFHLIGVFHGLDIVSALIQAFLTATSGLVYYLFRRLRGALLLAMVAHGLWDFALFLPQPTGSLIQLDRIALILVVLTSLIALIVLVVRERSVVVTRAGVSTR